MTTSKQTGQTPLILLCGEPLNKTWIWKINDEEVNLTGYTARAQVRAAPGLGDELLDLTTTNGKIVLGGAAGTINLTGVTVAAIQDLWTAAIAASARQAGVVDGRAAYLLGAWDLYIINPSGTPRRLLQGPCLIVPSATEPAA